MRQLTLICLLALPLWAQYTPPSGGGGSGTIAKTSNALAGDGAGNAVSAGIAPAAIAPLASPALTGTPTAPTRTQNDNSTKLATTAYTDLAVSNAIAGVNPAVAVQAASAAVLPNSPTYLNGVSGVGATLTTATTNTALVVDGYTMNLADRVLVKNQASALQNGVYFLSTLQSLGVAWVLTRALDYDQPSDMNNTGAIPVVNGTANSQTQWVLTSKITTVGTDAVTFTQFSLNPTTVATCTGDLSGTAPGCTVSKVNGASVAASSTYVGTNGSGQIIAAATPFTPDILAEQKSGGTLNSAKIEGSTVTATNTLTLLDITPGSAGYLSAFFLAFTNTDSVARTSSTLKITVDGETSGGTFNDRVPLYFGAEYCYNTVNYASRFMGCQQNNGNNIGFFSYLPIPFSTSLKIELVNGSGSATSTVWAVFSYATGVANTWPNTRKLRTSSGTLTNQTVNTVVTMVNATGLNPGRLFGVYMSIDSFPNSASPVTAPLEGNIKMYLDGAGSPTFESSGTEDYFHWSNYFEGTGTLYGSTTTGGNYSYDQGYTGVQFSSVSGPQTWNAYRYHIMDQVLFQNALKVTYNVGDSTQVNFTGGVRVAYMLWYYTQ